MKTTLNLIKEHKPCKSGWKILLASLNKTQADDETLEISHILKSNGLDDALWCLRAVQGKDKEIRLFAVWCAREVQYLLKDSRSIRAIDTAEKYANGKASQGDLRAAYYPAFVCAGVGYSTPSTAAFFCSSCSTYAAASAFYVACTSSDVAAYRGAYAAAYAVYMASFAVYVISHQGCSIKSLEFEGNSRVFAFTAYSLARDKQAAKLKEICNMRENKRNKRNKL